MNTLDPNEIISTVEKLCSYSCDSDFWQYSWTSHVRGFNSNLIIENSFSHIQSDDLYYNKCNGVIEMDIDLFETFLLSNEFRRNNPFLFKFNIIEYSPDNKIFEQEINLFGFNKTAICFKLYCVHQNNTRYYLYSSVTNPHSQIIPFRDSPLLYICFVVQQLSPTHINVTHIMKSIPIPWAHSTDSWTGLKRESILLSRFFKTFLDLQPTPEIPIFISVERNAFEYVLPNYKLPGIQLFENSEFRVNEKERTSTSITFVVQGKFTKKTKLSLSPQLFVYLVFQDRCTIVENQDEHTLLLHKGQSRHYQVATDQLEFSSFIYSDDCALFHFHSMNEYKKSFKKQSPLPVFHFNSSNVFLSKDINGYWNAQFYFDVTEKNTVLSMDIIQTFLQNMSSSLLTSVTQNEVESPTLRFAFDKKTPDKSSFFPQLSIEALKNIWKYLSKKDIHSLQLTNKQMHSLVLFSQQSEDSYKTNSYSRSSPNNSSESSKSPETFNHINLNTTQLYVKVDTHNDQTPKFPFSPFSLHRDNQTQPIILEGHTNIIRSVDIHSTLPQIVSGSSDRKMRLWDLLDTPIEGKVFIGPNSSIINTVYIDDYICASYKCGTIKYINPYDRQKSIIFDSLGGRIEGFYPLRNTDFISWNDTVHIISYQDFRQTLLYHYTDHNRKVISVRPFGSYSYLSCSADRTLHIWDIRQHAPTIHRLKPHKAGVLQVENMDDVKFCTLGNEKVVCIWDERMLTSPIHTLDNKALAITVKENRLFCGLEDSIVKSYTLDSREQLSVSCSLENSKISVVNARNGTIVVGMKDGRICVFKNQDY
ncbi:F-box and WD domain protein [Entamoeba marina]